MRQRVSLTPSRLVLGRSGGVPAAECDWKLGAWGPDLPLTRNLTSLRLSRFIAKEDSSVLTRRVNPLTTPSVYCTCSQPHCWVPGSGGAPLGPQHVDPICPGSLMEPPQLFFLSSASFPSLLGVSISTDMI